MKEPIYSSDKQTYDKDSYNKYSDNKYSDKSSNGKGSSGKRSSNKGTYGKGFLLSLCIHAFLLCLLLFSIETTVRREALPQISGEIVQASLLDENNVEEEVARLENQENQKKQAEKEAKKQAERNLEIKNQEVVKMKQEAEEKLSEIKLAKEKEQKKLVELQKEKEKVKEEKKLKALEERKKEEEEKELAVKKKTEKLDEVHKKSAKTNEPLKKKDDLKKTDDLKKKVELAKKTTDKKPTDKNSKSNNEHKTDKKTAALKNAVGSEDESLFPKSEWMTSEIEKYDALMKQKINQSWVRPVGLAEGLTCQLFARLLPDGSVVSPEVKISSGNVAFDQAAIAALQNASPLPMPSDPNLIDEFRQFNFKFTPPEEK